MAFYSRTLHGRRGGDILMRVNKTSVFQTLAQSLYLRRATRFDKVFPVLCSLVRVQTKRKEDKKQIFCPFLCQREVLYDFYVHPECSLEKNMTFGNV